jgi:hypothetical protein
MICVHEYPLSMVDHIGFRRFCAALQPLFKLVSRNTIKNDILDMYEVQRKALASYFQRCKSRIAIYGYVDIKSSKEEIYVCQCTFY